VLLFHGGFGWMSGGYVGVSVFFTLSGFLITSLLLREHDRSDSVSLGAFYGRRIRRLLPASLVCLALVSLAAAAEWFEPSDRLAGDVVAATLQVANWRALFGDLTYADMIGATAGQVGPVDHFWSLSIEEQFYWVWPLAAAFGMGRISSPRRRAWTLTALAAVAAVVAMVTARWFGADAAYWATPARLGEILVGAALAGWLCCVDVPRGSALLGWSGIAAVLAAAVMWPAGSGPAYEGWLPMFALASAAVVLGAQRPGVLRSALALRPLAELGRISYGVYLFHWPIFILLDDVPFALRVAVTLAVAITSFVLLEQPIRRARPSLAWLTGVAAVATAVVVVLALVVVPRSESTFATEVDTGDVGFTDVPGAPPATTAAPESVPTTVAASAVPVPVPQRPVRMLLVGDSTAVALGAGMVDWATGNPRLAQIESVATIGCGLMVGARNAADADGRFAAVCEEALGPRLEPILSSGAVDLAVVLVTLPDATFRVWDDEEGAIPAIDERFIERRVSDYLAFADRLRAAGVPRIAWVIPAAPTSYWVGNRDPAKNRHWVEEFGGALRSIAAERPQESRLVDFASWLEEREAGGDRSWRTDGLHLDPPAASRVMEEYLGNELLRAALGP
jgi:peptidoglycan/LPS O-acetylase OafA/YrhL